MSDPFHWIGITVCALAGIVLASFTIHNLWTFWWSSYGLHAFIGKPKLRAELVFYDRREILTMKGGGRKTTEVIATKPDKVDHYFDVPWWAGFSTRKGHFLFGFLRLRRHP